MPSYDATDDKSEMSRKKKKKSSFLIIYWYWELKEEAEDKKGGNDSLSHEYKEEILPEVKGLVNKQHT